MCLSCKMIATFILMISQMVQTTADNSQCVGPYFLNNGRCDQCPYKCLACQSENNCSICRNGVYGSQCTTPCPEYCNPHQCHPQQGHCTHGCNDGHFPLENKKGCSPCPINCLTCGSYLKCYTCQNGFYGTRCTEVCLSECEDGTCNRSTGRCTKCADGFYYRNSTCLQCPRECTSCFNATYCSECMDTNSILFEGKCIRKCSFATATFNSSSSQICGVSLDTLNQNHSSCLNISFDRSYTCTKLKYCIDCGIFGDKCPNQTTNEGQRCIGYEQCSVDCKAPPRDNVMQDDNRTVSYMTCEQTCSGNKSDDDTPFVCLDSIQEIVIVDEEGPFHIRCFQPTQQTEIFTVMMTTFDECRTRAVGIFTISAAMFVAILAVVVCWVTRRALQTPSSCSSDVFPERIEQGYLTMADIEQWTVN